MGERGIMRYKKQLAEYEEATKKVLAQVRRVQSAAEALKAWWALEVPNSYPKRRVAGFSGDFVEPDWPGPREIKSNLMQWDIAREQLVDAWERLGAERRDVAPPPIPWQVASPS